MTMTGQEAGAFEFTCRACPRKLLMRFDPKFEKIVLDHGDENAVHTGSTSRHLRMHSTKVETCTGWNDGDDEILDGMGIAPL